MKTADSINESRRQDFDRKRLLFDGRCLPGGYSVNNSLFTLVPVYSDLTLLDNHSSALNNLLTVGAAGECGHDSYASVNWKIK